MVGAMDPIMPGPVAIDWIEDPDTDPLRPPPEAFDADHQGHFDIRKLDTTIHPGVPIPDNLI